MTTWQLLRDSFDLESELIDVTTTDSANPFGDFAVATIDDIRGENFDNYEFGTRVDAQITTDTEETDLYIATTETVSTASGSTDTYGGTVYNQGTYSNAGTVRNTPDGQTDFTGFVVERRETDQSGADTLEVEAYTFDQFLRRNDVSNDQSGNTISTALENIIKNDTPVTFNSNLVNVGDDSELTLSLQDEKVETALQILAFKSENEAFGVNSDFEFFFRERETKHIDRGIDNTDWFNYDLPERGKEAVNEVEVRYNNGNDRVVVDNPGQKLDLQDNLDLPEPGTQRVRINRPEITDAKDAEDEGRRFLKFRNATLSGTVSTYGLYDAEPFDTIDVEIIDRGIDSEFIITKVEKNWARDETTLTLVENRGFEEDFIVRLTEKTERLDLRDSDPDAATDRITTTNIGIDVDLTTNAEIIDSGDTPISSGDTLTINSRDTEPADGTVTNAGTVSNAGTFKNQESPVAADATQITNQAFNQLRDGWIGDGNIQVANIVVGTDNAGLSRSNTELRNKVGSASVSESFPSNVSVKYTASLTQNNAEEIGVEDSSGNLLARATFDSATDIDGTVSLTVSFETDPDTKRAVATTDGQITARDIFADNSPNLSATYAYGSDDTSPTESDTGLGSQVYTTDLSEIRVQRASTDGTFDSLTSFSDSDPFVIQNDRVELAQASFTTESNNLTRSGTVIASDIEFSNDEAEQIEGNTSDSLELSFSLDYTIPASDVGVWVRLTTGLPGSGSGTGPGLLVTLNSDTWKPVSDNAGFNGVNWRDLANDPAGTSETYSGGDLTPGSYTLKIQGSGSSGDGQSIDVVSPLDNRLTWTFDSDTTNTGERVEGPELYPQQQTVSFDTASTRRDTDTARFTSTWNDTSNNQYVELANDGTNFTRFNNASSGSATFASEESGIDSNLAFSRFGTDANKTPTTGREGQYISDWNLFAGIVGIISDGIGEVNVRGIVQNSDLTVGDILREAAQLDTNGDALTRSVFADTEIESDTNDLISSETVTFRNP